MVVPLPMYLGAIKMAPPVLNFEGRLGYGTASTKFGRQMGLDNALVPVSKKYK